MARRDSSRACYVRTEKDFRALCDALNSGRDEVTTDIQLLRFPFEESSANLLRDALQHNHRVECLSLTIRNLTWNDALCLAKTIENMPSLRFLRLWDGGSNRVFARLLQAIAKSQSMQELHVYRVAISVHSLVDLMKSTSHLRDVQLVNTKAYYGEEESDAEYTITRGRGKVCNETIQKLKFFNSDTVVYQFWAQQVSLTNLQEFHVSGRGMDVPTAKSIQHFLRKTPNLQSLGLEGFQLDEVTIEPILQSMHDSSTISKLFLSSCVLPSARLYSFLLSDRGLSLLSFSHMNLSEYDVSLLAEALRVNKALNTLCLSSCRIGGVRALADSLHENRSMHTLKLQLCELYDDALTLLLEAAIVNKTLKHLDLSRNRFSLSGALSLAENLPRIKGLKELNVSFQDDLHQVALDALYNGLNRNRSLLRSCMHTSFEKQASYLGIRNRVLPLLQASVRDVPAALWPLALSASLNHSQGTSAVFYLLQGNLI